MMQTELARDYINAKIEVICLVLRFCHARNMYRCVRVFVNCHSNRVLFAAFSVNDELLRVCGNLCYECGGSGAAI